MGKRACFMVHRPGSISGYTKRLVRLQVEGLLSPRGQLFMVTVAENDPDDILCCCETNGLAGVALFQRWRCAVRICQETRGMPLKGCSGLCRQGGADQAS